MTLLQAFLLGIIEALTEFLPVSSTGHLILAGHLLNVPEGEFTKAFDVMIQAGAALAVVWYYRRFFLELTRDKIVLLGVGFLPAAVIGLALHKLIKAYLFGIGPVIAALLVGGIAMIVLERKLPRTGEDRMPSRLEALKIGFFQCLAMWPGTSRSMVTLLGGRFLGLSHTRAAEYSFLLAVPTLLAAAGLDAVKSRELLMHDSTIWLPLTIGFVTSFVVSLAVIHYFLSFLRKHTLEIFGWYRIALAVLLLIFLR